MTNEMSSGLAITLQTELVLNLHSRPGIDQQLRDDPSWLESACYKILQLVPDSALIRIYSLFGLTVDLRRIMLTPTASRFW